MKLRTRIGALAVVALSAAASCLIASGQASAAGEYGRYLGSTVYCANYFGPTQIQVIAHVSRYSGFSSQWVAYAHILKNVDTGQTTKLLVNNNVWYTFNDNHIINSGWPYVDSGFTWYGMEQVVPHGRYRVYTQYAWYSGYWVYSNWVEASMYNNYGIGTDSLCRL
jgi:hypothetical protein